MQDDLQTLASSDPDAVSIHSGFPNPALDRIGKGSKLALDLNALLIQHPSSTYLFRIAGHGHESYGLFDGDIAVIDRGLQPRASDLVLAWQPAGFIICLFGKLQLHDSLWGVVSTTIHQRQRRPS
ncbi:MAG: peptidase [Candidatus Saccharibacteria bacterium]|nr:peptidase [Candidatus Saccharibacteria bacterium]